MNFGGGAVELPPSGVDFAEDLLHARSTRGLADVLDALCKLADEEAAVPAAPAVAAAGDVFGSALPMYYDDETYASSSPESWLARMLSRLSDRRLRDMAFQPAQTAVGGGGQRVDPDSIREPSKAAMRLVGLDRPTLGTLGLDRIRIDRLYRSLFVYTVGFHQLMRELLAAAAPEAGLAGQVWQVFVHLLEACEPRHLVIASQEALARNRRWFHEQERKLQLRMAGIADDRERLKHDIERRRMQLEDAAAAQGRLLGWMEELKDVLDRERQRCRLLQEREADLQIILNNSKMHAHQLAGARREQDSRLREEREKVLVAEERCVALGVQLQAAVLKARESGGAVELERRRAGGKELELEAMADRLRVMQARAQEEASARRRAEMDLGRMTEERRKAGATVESLREELDRAKEALEEMGRARSSDAALSARQVRLVSQLTEAAAGSEQRALELQAKVKGLEAGLEERGQKLRKTEGRALELEERCDALLVEYAAMEEAHAAASGELNKTRLASERGGMLSEDVAQRRAQRIASLEDRLAETEAELKDVRKSLQSTEERLEREEGRSDDLRLKLRALEQRCEADAQGAAADVAKGKVAVERLEGANKELRGVLYERVSMATADAEATRWTATERLARSRARFKQDLESANRSFAAALKDMQDRAEAAEHEARAAQEHAARLDARLWETQQLALEDQRGLSCALRAGRVKHQREVHELVEVHQGALEGANLRAEVATRTYASLVARVNSHFDGLLALADDCATRLGSVESREAQKRRHLQRELDRTRELAERHARSLLWAQSETLMGWWEAHVEALPDARLAPALTALRASLQAALAEGVSGHPVDAPAGTRAELWPGNVLKQACRMGDALDSLLVPAIRRAHSRLQAAELAVMGLEDSLSQQQREVETASDEREKRFVEVRARLKARVAELEAELEAVAGEAGAALVQRELGAMLSAARARLEKLPSEMEAEAADLARSISQQAAQLQEKHAERLELQRTACQRAERSVRAVDLQTTWMQHTAWLREAMAEHFQNKSAEASLALERLLGASFSEHQAALEAARSHLHPDPASHQRNAEVMQAKAGLVKVVEQRYAELRRDALQLDKQFGKVATEAKEEQAGLQDQLRQTAQVANEMKHLALATQQRAEEARRVEQEARSVVERLHREIALVLAHGMRWRATAGRLRDQLQASGASLRHVEWGAMAEEDRMELIRQRQAAAAVASEVASTVQSLAEQIRRVVSESPADPAWLDGCALLQQLLRRQPQCAVAGSETGKPSVDAAADVASSCLSVLRGVAQVQQWHTRAGRATVEARAQLEARLVEVNQELVGAREQHAQSERSLKQAIEARRRAEEEVASLRRMVGEQRGRMVSRASQTVIPRRTLAVQTDAPDATSMTQPASRGWTHAGRPATSTLGAAVPAARTAAAVPTDAVQVSTPPIPQGAAWVGFGFGPGLVSAAGPARGQTWPVPPEHGSVPAHTRRASASSAAGSGSEGTGALRARTAQEQRAGLVRLAAGVEDVARDSAAFARSNARHGRRGADVTAKPAPPPAAATARGPRVVIEGKLFVDSPPRRHGHAADVGAWSMASEGDGRSVSPPHARAGRTVEPGPHPHRKSYHVQRPTTSAHGGSRGSVPIEHPRLPMDPARLHPVLQPQRPVSTRAGRARARGRTMSIGT